MWINRDRRLLLFPKGNNVDSLSIYMDAADSASLVFGWTRFAHFGLTVINQIKSNRSITKGKLDYLTILLNDVFQFNSNCLLRPSHWLRPHRWIPKKKAFK